MKKKIISILFVAAFMYLCVIIVGASSSDLKVSNFPNESVNLSLSNGYLTISNLPEDDHFEYMTAIFYKGITYKTAKGSVNTKTRSVKFEIPYYSNDNYEVSVFYGTDILTPFLPYTITININNGNINFVQSPTYSANKAKFNSSPSSKNAMDYYSFYYLSTDDGDEQVRSIAKSLISGINSDYEKAYVIYNWLAENFYYNASITSDSDFSDKSMKTLLVYKVCDSKDFASLYAFLLRAVGIPARSVYGIGLVNDRELSQPTVNHYWNEVYINGKWIFVDVAMSCPNKYLAGSKTRSPKTNNIYFDSTLEFFSYSHSIVSYEEPIYYEGYEKIAIPNKQNGTKKTVEALGLPASVVADTSVGKLTLPIEWNLSSAKYDPNIKEKQTFTVEGTFTLPSVFAAMNSLKQKVSVEITVNGRYPVKAEISSMPNELAFFENGKINTEGLELKVTFDNGDVEIVKNSFEVKYDFSTVGEVTVVVSYKDVQTSYRVYVVSKKPIELYVQKEPNKKVYLVNSEFERDGLVLTAKCDRGLTYEVLDYDIKYDFSEPGNREVVLTYDGLSAIIGVQVDSLSPVGIVILTYPENNVYYKGSVPHFIGVTAEITFNDGSKKTVSNELSYSYDLSKVGKTNVTVFYGDISTSFEIEVIDNASSDVSKNDESNDNSYIGDMSGAVSNNNSGVGSNSATKGENKHSYVVELIGIAVVSILLIVISVFAIMRANNMKSIHDWIKSKK